MSVIKLNLVYPKSAPPLDLLINTVAFFFWAYKRKGIFDFPLIFSPTSSQSPYSPISSFIVFPPLLFSVSNLTESTWALAGSHGHQAGTRLLYLLTFYR